jgi:putative membrane protein
VASLGLSDLRVRMIYRAIVFSHALRDLLRRQPMTDDMRILLLPSEWEQLALAGNKPDFLMLRMGQDLRLSLQEGRIDPCLAVAIDATLSAMTTASAACERIRNLYCFLLPFGLVDSIGFMTPFVVAIVAYTFFGLDALGDEIEEPFGSETNDLPLDAICRAIEIDLRASLQDTVIPPPLVPINFCLT